MGAWLSVFPNTINDTLISSNEFKIGLHLRYGITPPHFPKKCDGCLCPFSLSHAIKCKVGGLIIQGHDEVNYQLGQLCTQVLKKSAVHAEPLIFKKRDIQQGLVV